MSGSDSHLLCLVFSLLQERKKSNSRMQAAMNGDSLLFLFYVLAVGVGGEVFLSMRAQYKSLLHRLHS